MNSVPSLRPCTACSLTQPKFSLFKHLFPIFNLIVGYPSPTWAQIPLLFFKHLQFWKITHYTVLVPVSNFGPFSRYMANTSNTLISAVSLTFNPIPFDIWDDSKHLSSETLNWTTLFHKNLIPIQPSLIWPTSSIYNFLEIDPLPV